MMPKYVVVAAVLITVASPVLAVEYYVAHNPTTGKCYVGTEKPDGQTRVMVGTVYKTKDEARAARTASADCKKE